MGDSNTPYFAEGAVCKAIPRLVLCGYHIRPYLPTAFGLAMRLHTVSLPMLAPFIGATLVSI